MPQVQVLSQDIHPGEQYIDNNEQKVDGNNKESILSSAPTNINDLQLIYDSQIGQFISIQEHESNIVRCDSMKFIDRNFFQTREFTTISSRPSVEEPEQKSPWNSFWIKKQKSNQLLLKAVSNGKKDIV